MVQLRDSFQELKGAGIQIVGISYDSVDVLKGFSEAEDIPFPLLSDEDSKTIHAYGLHNEVGLPHPGTILVDATGVIRAKIFKEGYRTRHTIDELMKASAKMK